MNGFFRRNAILAAIEIVGRVPLLFTLGYLASSIGPDTYGDWALVLASVGILTSLGALGLSSSISRMASGAAPQEAKGWLVYALRTTTVVALAFGLLLALARQPLGAALGIEPNARDLLALGGVLAIAGTIEALLDAYFKARERIVSQAVLVVGRTCIEVATVILVFGTSVFSTDHQGRLVLYVAITVAAKALLLYPWLILSGPRAVSSPDREARRMFLRYGLPMIPAGLVVWLTTQGDRLVLGHAVSSDALGWYAFGAALAWNLSYLGLAVYPLLLPRASVLHDNDQHDEVVTLFDASQRVYFALFAAVGVALALLARDIVDVTAGSDFAPAAPILLLLSLAVGLEGLLGIFQWVFHLLRRTTLVLAFNVLYMILQVISVFVVATVTGSILAAAWTALGVVVVANALRYAVARRLYVVRLQRTLLVAVVAVGVLIALAAELGQDLPLGVRLGLAALAGLAGLAGALHAAGASSFVGRAVRPMVGVVRP
jgi:PST family polysaccharide transporter